MKLLTQHDKGKMRTCSARCYNAEPHTNCACICGGKLHAVGEQKALATVREMFLGQNTDENPDSGKGIPKVTRAAERALKRMEASA